MNNAGDAKLEGTFENHRKKLGEERSEIINYDFI
jgi:hypothetical protein